MKYRSLIAGGLILLSTIAYASSLAEKLEKREKTDISYVMRHMPRSVLR